MNCLDLFEVRSRLEGLSWEIHQKLQLFRVLCKANYFRAKSNLMKMCKQASVVNHYKTLLIKGDILKGKSITGSKLGLNGHMFIVQQLVVKSVN